MYLSKDPSGIWYLYYTGIDGKTKRSSTRSRLKPDALKFLQTFKQSKQPRSKQVTLSAFTKDFLAFAQGNFSPRTVQFYDYSLKKLAATIGDISLPSITPMHYDMFKTERLKTMSAITVNIDLRTIRASFNTAVRWGLIETNPFSRQKLVPIPEATPLFFTKDDFRKLINSIKEEWLKEMVIFATLTGLRRGELVNLRWSEVDLDRKTISIQSSPTFKTKNGKKRIVPLNDTAYYILLSKQKSGPSTHVFTLNGKPVLDEWLSHKFKWYVYDCKFREDRLHFHSLRHTFASWLVQDGVSLYEVQKLLGHSNISVTQIYSHLQPELMHNTVNKLNFSLN